MAIKPIMPDSKATIVWHQDPAIDHDACDVSEYVEKMHKDPSCWRDILKFKDGEQPTEFVIGVIPPSELNAIEDACLKRSSDDTHRRELCWRSFLHGLRDIENGPQMTVVERGRERKEVPKVDVDGVEYVSPSWLASQFHKHLRQCALDVGAVIWQWNLIDQETIKN